MSIINMIIVAMVVCVILLEWRYIYHSFRGTLPIYHMEQFMKSLEREEFGIVVFSTRSMNGTLMNVKASNDVINQAILGLNGIIDTRKSLLEQLKAEDKERDNGC